ncbi:hypothetical protein JCGZ_11199 [Jatropha curcas]|uniref:Uncharacterized protein n=1 Tax=Jatropha curcas TaxID=180498 RepID=A0A067KFE4_JATCU|nr:hypothetical protein JCGZ_11199 [Jatropha curcas]
MTNMSIESHNLEVRDDNHVEAAGQAVMPLPQTTDRQVVVALAQAYSQFTKVLKFLLETPHPGGELMPLGEATNLSHKEHDAPLLSPKRQSHLASEQLHKAGSEANLSIATMYSPELSHTRLVMDNANLRNVVKELVRECRETGEVGDY